MSAPPFPHAPPTVQVAGEEIAERLQALRSPATYDTATSVEVIETHFAWVFLAGEHAYKMKKPVIYPQLDLRSIQARESNCAEELRLNRRLAPDVYRGIVPLVRGSDGTLRLGRLGGEGTVVDWLVWMKRLPAELMLDRAIAAGTASAGALDAVGVMLAQFYREQQRISFLPDEYVARISEQIQTDQIALCHEQLGLDPQRVHAALAAMQESLVAVHEELAVRALERRIVDAHGDLRPEHICLCQPPCVIDSLEFSQDLRTLDPMEELAFLQLECEVAGDASVGERVLNAYRGESRDRCSARLFDFYQSRRAMVRAKIVAWHLCDPSVMALAPWREQAQSYLRLSERCARQSISRRGGKAVR